MNINIEQLSVERSNFHDHSAVVLQESHAAAPDKDAEILPDLERVQEQLDETQATLSYLLSQLQDAVKKKDKSNVEKLRDLVVKSGGTVLAGIASKALLAWLGIK